MEMGRLTRDGTAEPVSRDQILRHERGQGNIHFSCSADHVQDWQPYPIDPYSCYMCDYTYIMVTTPTQINKDPNRGNPCHVQHQRKLETYWRQDDISGYEVQFLLLYLECCQYLRIWIMSYSEDCVMCCLSTKKVIKRDSKTFRSYRRVIGRQVMRHFTSNGTDRSQNVSSHIITPY